MNIFDRTRQKIKNNYQSRHDYSCEDVKILELHDLWEVDNMEKEASKSLLSKIKYSFAVWWKFLSNEGKINTIIGLVMFAFVCLLFIINADKFAPYYLAKQLCSTAFFCFVILSSCFIVSTIKNKKVFKSRAFYISWLLALLLSIPHIPILAGYGTTQIGDFYEKAEYTENYIVYMSRDPETVANRKVYTLPAEIQRIEDYLGTEIVNTSTTYITGETGEHEITTLNYHIIHLYFPNGGYLYFDEDDLYDSVLYVNKETKVTDYKGEDYYITLTTRKSND